MRQPVFAACCLVAMLALANCSSKFSEHLDPQLAISVDGDFKQMNIEKAEQLSSAEDTCYDGNKSAVCDQACCDYALAHGSGCEYCHEFYEFNPLGEGQERRDVLVELYNNGDADLEVEEIFWLEDRQLRVEGRLGEIDNSIFIEAEGAFDATDEDIYAPFVIETSLATPKLQFRVVYEPPVGDMAIHSKTLVVKTNDPDFGPYDDAYRLVFRVKNIGPEMQVNRKSVTFSCVSGCTEETIIVDNIGTDTLEIKQISFASPTSEFDISNPPVLPAFIKKKGDPSYNALTFKVRYCPGDENYDDTNNLEIYSNDPHLPGMKLVIAIKVVQAPAILAFSDDSPFGYLDFSDETTHKINIYNKHADECKEFCPEDEQCCGCPIQIKGVDFDPPDAVDWYTVVAKDPSNDETLPLPRSLKGGGSIAFQVDYAKPAGHPEDKNATMCIRYVAPEAGPQNYCASLMAQSSCEFSVAPNSQVLQFNSSSPAEVKEKPAILINNGSAACTVSHVSVSDKWGGVSKDFSLKDVIPGGSKVEPFTLLPVWVQFSPHSTDLTGKLVIEYVDDLAGVLETVVNLSGTKENQNVLPIAEPGVYEGVVAGQSLNLNGCSSTAGEKGHPVFDNGYIWFLLSKPADSGAKLNIESGCITPFVPDLPGKYEVGLIVYDNTNYYQSDLAIATIDVAAAE